MTGTGRDFALIPLACLVVAAWHMRPTIFAAVDAWRRSRHPDQLGVIRRADTYRRTR